MWLSSIGEYTVSNDLADVITEDREADFVCEWHFDPSGKVITNYYYSFNKEIFIRSVGTKDYSAFSDVIYSGNKGIKYAFENRIENEKIYGTGDDILIEQVKGIPEIDFLPVEIKREDV
jgi:hypothetical protein